MRADRLRVAYTDEYLAWQLGAGHPTNPERAQRAAMKLWRRVEEAEFPIPRLPAAGHQRPLLAALDLVHDPAYVRAVLGGECGEWAGRQPRLGSVAALMFEGTRGLAGDLVADRERGVRGVYFNPQGAKHHAMRSRSGGFCVFNDMAWAAVSLSDAGHAVGYLDWDAHHGDGVEALLEDRADLVTCSIHDGTIFPGTGRDGHRPDRGVYDWALEAGAGDWQLLASVREALAVLDGQGLDVLLMAVGADGLRGDPLSTLTYTLKGVEGAARVVSDWAQDRGVSLLVGGAGGYQPLTQTPECWARVIETLVS